MTFGRKPRLKTSQQVLRELEALRKARMEMVFVVDDNLIGNKAAIKVVLRDIIRWQHHTGFPITFFAEASIDLADDPELMQLMTEANFTSVFIGIETPNEAALRETKKFQNIRGGGTLVDKVRAIQSAGLEVWCGLIVGFDSDNASVFSRQRDFIEQTRISHAMLGMLAAIPKTPLHERLAREGRLDDDEENAFGTNVVPAGMSREELRDGYLRLQKDMHEPEGYFDRLDRLFVDEAFTFSRPRGEYLSRHPMRRLRANAVEGMRALAVFARLITAVRDPALRRIYGQRFMRILWKRPDTQVWMVYAIKCVIHYHHFTLASGMGRPAQPVVNTF